MMGFYLTILFTIVFIIFSVVCQDVGLACDDGHPCPFKDGCVKNAPTPLGYICICRLAHKYENGSWMAGFENCTDNYSPWSLYPYENSTTIPEPLNSYEIIRDEKITASSESNGYLAKYGRLHSFLGGKGAWCGSDDSGEWIQVDLGKVSLITMLGTQGGGVAIPYTVLTFTMQLMNVAILMDVKNSSNHVRVFTGNTDQNTIIYNFFDPDTYARYLRIIPLEKQNLKCLRFDVYGNREMNECLNTDGWNQCSEYSHCQDTIAAYTCTCYMGYDDVNRDGFVCIEVNECRTRVPHYRHNCSDFASCKNLPGFFNCSCWEGYIGDGYYCEDYNECLNEIPGEPFCHENGYCVNEPGKYSCKCKIGYSGDGKYVCNDDDECKNGVAKCSKDADCTNTAGSFKCTCRTGFRGNGTFCDDINECDLTGSCHDQATCTNTEGSYKCDCRDGFAGSGRWCADINECVDGTAMCRPHTFCYNYPGGFICMCPKIMPLQYTYNALERTILDHMLMNFRDVTKEDWRYPVDHHAHIIRTVYQLVMQTYNYHFIETRDPFFVTRVAGDAFGVELYDVRCKDVTNFSFPNTCHDAYRKTKFYNFTDTVDIWLVREPERQFELYATAPPAVPPNINSPTLTPPPIITHRPPTTWLEIVNGTEIVRTEQPRDERKLFTDCGGILNETVPEGSRTFTSPNYPLSYPNMSLCVWKLEAPIRHNVYVEFDIESFETEYDRKCSFDFVEVREGAIDGPILAKYCGSQVSQYPKAVRSGKEVLYVIFQTDEHYEYRGFKINWGYLQPRVSIGCIIYNQMSTMPASYQSIWEQEIELEDRLRYRPVSRLMACKQYPQCNNSRPGPIIYTFQHFRQDKNDKVCIRWDLSKVGATYSMNGCKKRKTNATHTECECYTWGIVAVLGRAQSGGGQKRHEMFALGKNTFFSVLFTILILIFTMLYLICKDQWIPVLVEVFTRKEYDSGRVIQLHILLSTLFAEIFFSIISFNVEATSSSCYFVTFLFYYLLQTVFFWMFVYAIFLQTRIQEIFDSEKYNTYKIYLFVGYGVPFVVTMCISGLNFYEEAEEKLCWLKFEGTTVWGFSGVIVTLCFATIVLLLNVTYNAQRMENGYLIQHKCLKTLFIATLLLFTSFYGALSLQSREFFPEYLFSMFNLLLAISIFIMYCILRREDPIIPANQVGPLPDFSSNDKTIEEFNTDNELPKFKDMAGTWESSDEEDEMKNGGIGEMENEKDMNNSSEIDIKLSVENSRSSIRRSAPILVEPMAKASEDAKIDDGVDNDGFELDPDEDQEIMYRTDEI